MVGKKTKIMCKSAFSVKICIVLFSKPEKTTPFLEGGCKIQGNGQPFINCISKPVCESLNYLLPLACSLTLFLKASLQPSNLHAKKKKVNPNLAANHTNGNEQEVVALFVLPPDTHMQVHRCSIHHFN